MHQSHLMHGSDTSANGVSRRAFVRGATGLVVGGLALATGFNPLGGTTVVGAAPVLSRATFDACVGDKFHVASAGAIRSLDLFKSRALRFGQPATQPPAGKDSFSLLFRGPAGQPLAQGVYTLEHRRTGQFTVLLAPMRPEPDARYYEVIFNRAAPR
jgi:hypothetical protein